MFDVEKVSNIFQKYNVQRILWYTDYPEKPHWKNPFGLVDLEVGLRDFHAQPASLLYVHMPYCHTQCYFCNCKTIISLDYKNVQNYLTFLFKEIEMHVEFCDRNGLTPNISEIHLGGGSPTYMTEQDFFMLIKNLRLLVDFSKLNEFSIEIDPRRINPDKMFFYSSMGINRISFGIQDLDLEVQKAINRIQPDSLVRRLLTPEIRSLFPYGVNFDVMGGLPNQTKESFRMTMEKVIDLSPDRVSLLQMSLVPQYSPHQLLMPLDRVPNNFEMKLLFMDALELLTANGYVRTSYDHFAKPSDSVVEARNDNKMKWGYFGPTSGGYEDVLGIGISSYSRLGSRCYVQNFYELDNWERAILDNKHPLYRGHTLSDDDVIRRDVIQTLRNYFVIKYADIEERYDINFKNYFHTKLDRLIEFAEDGLLEFKPNGLELTEFGSLFADFLAGTFDAYHRN